MRPCSSCVKADAKCIESSDRKKRGRKSKRTPSAAGSSLYSICHGFSPLHSPMRDSLGRRACWVQIGAALLRVEPACGTRTEVSLPAVISSHRCGHGPQTPCPIRNRRPNPVLSHFKSARRECASAHEAHRSHGRSGLSFSDTKGFQGKRRYSAEPCALL
jgi:hypothetical protein